MIKAISPILLLLLLIAVQIDLAISMRGWVDVEAEYQNVIMKVESY